MIRDRVSKDDGLGVVGVAVTVSSWAEEVAMSDQDGSVRAAWWPAIQTLISVSEHDEQLQLDEDLLDRVTGPTFDAGEAVARWVADVLSD